MKKGFYLIPLLAVGMLFASCAKDEAPSRNAGKYLAQERAKFDDQLTADEKSTLETATGLNDEKSVDAALSVARAHSSELQDILRTVDPEDFYLCEDFEPKGCEEPEYDEDDCDWDFDIDWDDFCEDEDDDNTSTTSTNTGTTTTTNANGAPDFSQYTGEQIKCMNFLMLDPS